MFNLGLNWKMQPANLNSALELVANYPTTNSNPITVFAPYIYLSDIKKNHPNCDLGAQDLSEKAEGAFSGQVSGVMLKNLGLNSVLIGHSETRLAYNLTNQNINQKVMQALQNDLLPILCLGYSQNLEGVDYEELEQQIVEGLSGNTQKLSEDKKIILAYEPVWAIGKQQAASSEVINQVAEFILNTLTSKLGLDEKQQQNIEIWYGGSIDENNCLDIAQNCQAIQGFLIGSSSLKPEKIKLIVEKLETL